MPEDSIERVFGTTIDFAKIQRGRDQRIFSEQWLENRLRRWIHLIERHGASAPKRRASDREIRKAIKRGAALASNWFDGTHPQILFDRS